MRRYMKDYTIRTMTRVKWLNNYSACLFAVLMLSLTSQSCGKDNNEDSASKEYSLEFYGSHVERYRDYNWQVESPIGIKLRFGEGIPKNSEWTLESDEPWVRFSNSEGKVSDKSEYLTLTLKDNNSYEEREAHITLKVPNGLYDALYQTTLTLYQHGYEYSLESGEEFTVVTNRAKANNSYFKVDIQYPLSLMDIDWGDGSRHVLTQSDFHSSSLTLSHYYSLKSTYRIRIRFANTSVAKFWFEDGLSLEEVGGSTFITSDSRPYGIMVTYNESSGFYKDLIWN